MTNVVGDELALRRMGQVGRRGVISDRDGTLFRRILHLATSISWRALLRDVFGVFQFRYLFVRRKNPHGHKVGVIVSPSQRLAFRFKETVDHERAPFGRGPARAPRCFSIDHVATGVDCNTGGVWKYDFAAISNSPGIDCTMSRAQSRAGGALVSSGVRIRTAAAAGPVDGDTREHGLFASGNRRSQDQTRYK